MYVLNFIKKGNFIQCVVGVGVKKVLNVVKNVDNPVLFKLQRFAGVKKNVKITNPVLFKLQRFVEC